eukprot:scaffold62599_cov66-Phaeocystis_antarctica.AAC.9
MKVSPECRGDLLPHGPTARDGGVHGHGPQQVAFLDLVERAVARQRARQLDGACAAAGCANSERGRLCWRRAA